MDTNCHYRIGFHQPMPSIKISIFRMQDPGLVEANDCIITTNTSHNSESSENLNNFLRIMERLTPGLFDSKALYNNASQMARQQMGHFCMICLDYIPTYLEYLGNWSPLIFIHTPSHTLSAITSPKASQAVLFWGDSLFKVIPEHPLDTWGKSHNPWSTSTQLSPYSSLLLFALTESSLPPIQVLDVYEIPQPRAPRIPAKEHMSRSLRVPLTWFGGTDEYHPPFHSPTPPICSPWPQLKSHT